MRMVQIALFLLALNLGMYFVTSTGLFGVMPYSSSIISTAQSYSSLTVHANSELEQFQMIWKILTTAKNILTWDWIANLFMPWYATDPGVKHVVDGMRFMLSTLMLFGIAWMFVEIVRNRTTSF